MNKPLENANRMYSILNVKKVDATLRKISGIATTPTTDRMGDIVEPKGVIFKNPMPLLWQHNHEQPVGEVRFGKATDDGIPFEAQVADPNDAESSNLRERLLEAWDSVKMGLVKAVSIGFVPLEYNFMKEGGMRFEKSEVYELSLVTIPANAEATITTIRAFDIATAMGGEALANLKKHWDAPVPVLPSVIKRVPAIRAKPLTPAKLATKESSMPRTIAEQISAYEAKHAANIAAMKAIMDKSEETGETLGQEQSEKYDALDSENISVIDHIKRLKRLDDIQKSQLMPVVAEEEKKRVGDPDNSFRRPVVAHVKANVPEGTSFIRYCMALAAGKGDLMRSIRYAKASMQHGGWSNTPEVLDMVENLDEGMMHKAAVGAGTTTDATWASPLVAYTQAAEEYINLLRPATIIGRIPGLRRVPFNIQIPRATAGTTVGWVGENAPKPVSNMQFDSITLRWAKAAGIVVITQELARFSNPAAEGLVRADMIAQMAQFLDRQFVDPAVAAVTNVSPASITSGVSAVTATGTNDAAFRTDAKTMINTFLTNNLSTAGAVWIGTQQQATAFSLMLNALGQASYPTMTPTGGTLIGYPYIASENIPATGGSPTDGYPLILAIAPEILLADDGQVIVDASNQASVNMDSAPDSPPSASTVLVSLWQMNMTGIRAERWINWLKRRSTAVGYIQNAKYV